MTLSTSPSYIAAIDQGTTSTRCMIFDHEGNVRGKEQREHKQIFPKAGWVEHDPIEIWQNTRLVGGAVVAGSQISTVEIATLGITNQRETTIIWDKDTGQPIYNAIVWQDTRTEKICKRLEKQYGSDFFIKKTGLPISTYFSGPKIKWILENVEGAKTKAKQNKLCFGTVDTWILWNLTKNSPEGPHHFTDVTNASRTLLMDIHSLTWDPDLCEIFEIPPSMLPEIKSSSEEYGKIYTKGLFKAPISGILGDQQAAAFGQACTQIGDAKNTYGTGNFLIFNTGKEIRISKNGLLTTVCYKLGKQDPVYALEGSIAVTGSLVQWLRDNLNMFSSATEVERLANSVADNGGAYFVPAFSGLLAPRWRSDARGVLVGLTRYINKGHIARAALEAAAYQTREVIEAMNKDAGTNLTTLKVDGGMVVNEMLMQFQADILNVPVVRPKVNETTTLGAAYAAGMAVGFWENEAEIRKNWAGDKTWNPQMEDKQREQLYKNWNKAVKRSFNWV